MFIEKITIGNTLEAAIYAIINDTFFLSTLSFGPIFYDFLEVAPFSSVRKDFCWSRALFSLAMEGRLLNQKVPVSVKIEDDFIKVTEQSTTNKYRFSECYIFDSTGISLENQILETNHSLYRVYDDFEISNLGGKHKMLQPFVSKNNLAKKINFYISDRVDGANYVTDCVVESVLTKEQLHDVNYSDSLVRFIVLRHLKSIGIEGNFMNLYKNGTPKFRKPKIVHKKRIITEIEQNKFKDSKNVKFVSATMEEMINGISTTRP